LQSPKRTVPVHEALRAKSAAAGEAEALPQADQHAIEEGRKPPEPRRKDLAAVKAKAIELYGIPAAGLSTVAPIESGFHFAAADSDNDLQYLQVEILLDEASSLLDRCFAHRAKRDQLQLEKWRIQLELDRFFRFDQLRAHRLEAGVETVAYERAVLEAGAESSAAANHKSAETQLKTLSDDLLATGFNKRMAAKELSAWISAYPLKDGELRGDNASYTFDGVQKTKPDHLFEAARMEADEAAWEQATDLAVRRFQALGESESASLRKESWNRQARCAKVNIGFRREGGQVEADAGWERAFQAQAPNGLLNFEERIAPVEREFAADFREALAHMTAARRGLKELFDYDSALPQEGSAGYLDAVGAWVRQAKMALARGARFDQSYTRVVSLKDLAKSQWESGRATGEWSFDLPDAVFDGQAHVRLREVGLAVVPTPEAPEPASPKKTNEPPPAKPEGYWSARITAPAAGVVRFRSGASHEIDQKGLPPCFLGRVAAMAPAREPEMAAVAFANASPIGKQWRVTLSQKSTTGAALGTLDDVHLYLRVTVRGMA